MEESELCRLIRALEYGTRLQIGVVFFGARRNSRLLLPHGSTIHNAPYCRQMKEDPRGLRRCRRCRELAIQKAFRTKEAFGGICVNGLYEYTHPVRWRNEIVGIIFVGNILEEAEGAPLIRRRLAEHGLAGREAEFLGSTEHSYTEEQCRACAGLIDSYIQMVFRLYPCAEASLSANQLTSDLLAYLEENSLRNVSFETLANRFHYNGKYLGRQFKKETGISIRQYLCNRRLESAMLMLRATNDPITEIATKSGFDNVTYFNHCFVRYTGVSPTVWRRQNRKD